MIEFALARGAICAVLLAACSAKSDRAEQLKADGAMLAPPRIVRLLYPVQRQHRECGDVENARPLRPSSFSTLVGPVDFGVEESLSGEAYIQICRDPVCEEVVQTIGRDRRSGVPLPPGRWFWRVGAAGGWSCRVWQFTVGGLKARKMGQVGVRLDVNGDGFEDTAEIGRNGDEYVVGVRLGSLRGLVPESIVTHIPAVPLSVVAAAGDVDGDGYGDLWVGQRESEDALGRQGIVLLFRGTPTGALLSSGVVLPPSPRVETFGVAVWGGADVDGDGSSDVVIGASGGRKCDTCSEDMEERQDVFVFSGADGFAAEAKVILQTASGTHHFSPPRVAVGDLDGDGAADVVVAFAFDRWPTIHFGGRRQDSAMHVPDGNVVHPIDVLDANGDGLQDLVVMNSADGLHMSIYPGKEGGPSPEPWATYSYQAGLLGQFVSSGDVDSDGYEDMIFFDASRFEISILAGSKGGLRQEPVRFSLGASTLGSPSLLAGDYDGDGRVDFVLCGIDTAGQRACGVTMRPEDRALFPVP